MKRAPRMVKSPMLADVAEKAWLLHVEYKLNAAALAKRFGVNHSRLCVYFRQRKKEEMEIK